MEEYILCAAVWYKGVHPRAKYRPINTPGGVVLCGFRHGDILSQVLCLTGKDQGEHIQGFLTSKNRFVDREEGAKIFIENGGELKYSKTKLYSEDLY